MNYNSKFFSSKGYFTHILVENFIRPVQVPSTDASHTKSLKYFSKIIKDCMLWLPLYQTVKMKHTCETTVGRVPPAGQ